MQTRQQKDYANNCHMQKGHVKTNLLETLRSTWQSITESIEFNHSIVPRKQTIAKQK